MAIGITGWRMHLGAIFPTPVPPRFVREFYEVVPDGVDVTTNSLTIQALTDQDLGEAVRGMERAAKQLANFDADIVYQSGVPPIVLHGPGFAPKLDAQLTEAAGIPAVTDMTGVIDSLKHMGLSRIVMATPFKEIVNERLETYLAAEGVTMVHRAGLGIERNVEIRRLPISAEYVFARSTFEQAKGKADALYIPCGGWGSIHNVERLEQDLGVTVITWMNTMIWTCMKRHGVAAPIRGCGKLLSTL